MGISLSLAPNSRPLTRSFSQERVTIATTTLATAGVVFSLLTLPLSTVAAQYRSRLLRVFLGDRTTQIVLGMFVGAGSAGFCGFTLNFIFMATCKKLPLDK